MVKSCTNFYYSNKNKCNLLVFFLLINTILTAGNNENAICHGHSVTQKVLAPCCAQEEDCQETMNHIAVSSANSIATMPRTGPSLPQRESTNPSDGLPCGIFAIFESRLPPPKGLRKKSEPSSPKSTTTSSHTTSIFWIRANGGHKKASLPSPMPKQAQ